MTCRKLGQPVVIQKVYKQCAAIARKYAKDDVSPGIQMGVSIAGSAIAKDIERAALSALSRRRK